MNALFKLTVKTNQFVGVSPITLNIAICLNFTVENVTTHTQYMYMYAREAGSCKCEV